MDVLHFEFVPEEATRGHRLGPYSRHPRHTIEPGCYTDDTQMSIAVAELLVSDTHFSRENLAELFVSCFQRDPRAGYARGEDYHRTMKAALPPSKVPNSATAPWR